MGSRGSEQVRANWRAHSGVVGLGANFSVMPGLPKYASVPRDNFVPVGNLVKHTLWAVQTRSGSRGRCEHRLEGPCQGP
ncbi:hypothetical protein EMIT0194P_130209 [Pseudomonas serbica]